MRLKLWLILILQAALVFLLAVAVKTGLLPLGIPGEWQWSLLKPTVHVPWDWLALSLLGVIAYAVLVGLGLRAFAPARRDGSKPDGWPPCWRLQSPSRSSSPWVRPTSTT